MIDEIRLLSGEGERKLVGFPFDRVADRMVCSKGERSKRLNVIGADSEEEGCGIGWECASLERVADNVGWRGERGDLEEATEEAV